MYSAPSGRGYEMKTQSRRMLRAETEIKGRGNHLATVCSLKAGEVSWEPQSAGLSPRFEALWGRIIFGGLVRLDAVSYLQLHTMVVIPTARICSQFLRRSAASSAPLKVFRTPCTPAAARWGKPEPEFCFQPKNLNSCRKYNLRYNVVILVYFLLT